MPNCRTCGKEIVWVEMKSGKKNPLDPKKLTIVTDAGNVITGRQSHYSTCPQSKDWRGKTRETKPISCPPGT